MKQEDTEKSTSEEIQSFARTKTEKAQEEHLKPAIVESGPVQVDDDIVEDFDNDTENDEEDNEEEHISASQLLGFGKADDGKLFGSSMIACCQWCGSKLIATGSFHAYIRNRKFLPINNVY